MLTCFDIFAFVDGAGVAFSDEILDGEGEMVEFIRIGGWFCGHLNGNVGDNFIVY
jgi:hypothetical protein